MELSPLQYDAYRIAAPTFAGVLLVMLAFSRSRSLRAHPASKVFALYVLATVGYLVSNTLEISSKTPDGNLFWSRFIYLFIPFIPLLWLNFTVRISRDGRGFSLPQLAALCLIPVATFGIVFSDRFMDLVWPSIKFVPAGKYVVSVRSHGPWFVIHSLYAYSVSLTGLGIAAKALTTKRLYFRKRAALLLVGVSVPIAANLFYILRPIPGLVKDFTPIAYAISGFFFFFVLYRMDAFSIIPVAREQLVEHMPDGILVLDAEHRIADANPAALEMLGAGEDVLGRSLEEDGGTPARLPEAVGTAALTGRKGVFSKTGRDGRESYYSVESIDLQGRHCSRGRLVVIRDETELRSALRHLEELARTDALTGIANRRGFMENAEALVSAAERYREPLSVAMFDLDSFKRINDEHGHAAGDEVLRVFAGILQMDLRGADQAGRIGGEEFALILPKTPAAGAFSVCERIREDFSYQEFGKPGGQPVRLTVSVGIASAPKAPYALDELLSAADSALYRAKAAGKNLTIGEGGWGSRAGC